MEWLEAKTWRRDLRKSRSRRPSRVCCCDGWRRCWRWRICTGIIHRDVNPSNLFLRYGRMEETTVLDFGVARRGLALARDPNRRGDPNPEFMAPEQA